MHRATDIHILAYGPTDLHAYKTTGKCSHRPTDVFMTTVVMKCQCRIGCRRQKLGLSLGYIFRLIFNKTLQLSLILKLTCSWLSIKARWLSLAWIFLTKAGVTLSSYSSAGVYRLRILTICDTFSLSHISQIWLTSSSDLRAWRRETKIGSKTVLAGNKLDRSSRKNFAEPASDKDKKFQHGQYV